MWKYGRHFHTKDVDDGFMIEDYGVEVEFDQSSHDSHHDHNIMQGTLGYVGKIQEVIQVDFPYSNVLFLGASGGTPLIGIM